MAFDFKKEYAGGCREGCLFSRPAAVKHLFLTSSEARHTPGLAVYFVFGAHEGDQSGVSYSRLISGR